MEQTIQKNVPFKMHKQEVKGTVCTNNFVKEITQISLRKT